MNPPMIPHSHELCEGCLEGNEYAEALEAARVSALRAWDEMTVRAEALAGALREYGWHKSDCDLMQGDHPGSLRRCTCGLSEELGQ